MENSLVLFDPPRALTWSGIKVPKPESYNGNSSPEALETWINGVIRWTRLHSLLHTDMDVIVVPAIGQFLEGTAEEWYNLNVEWSTPLWTMFQVFEGLRTRFIQESDVHVAATKFENLRQGMRCHE
jgi:hypothetical protein